MNPPSFRIVLTCARGSKGRRAVADPFARQRRHRIKRKRCFAFEIWDAKGVPVATMGYGDAASRLKFGSCEDDELSQVTNRADARRG
jgi:hypothetical protein